MVGGHDVSSQLALHLVRMQLVVGEALLDTVDLVDRQRRCQAEVLDHELVGNGHDLAEHISRLVGDADVVAIALRHLLHAIGALEQRQRQAHLGLHAHFFHELAASQQVEQLVGTAELDVGFDDDRVVSLHDRVEELMHGDGLVARIAVVEVVALENARNGELAG